MVCSNFQHSPFKSINTQIRSQCCPKSIVTLCMTIKVRIAGFCCKIYVIIILTPFKPTGCTDKQTGRDIFRATEIVYQIRFIILQLCKDNRSKHIHSIIIQVVGISIYQWTMNKMSCKKTSCKIDILVIAIPLRQRKRASQPYILKMVIKQLIQAAYIPIRQIL